ncbi:MAG: FecR family protein, partial [Actinomycetota bacterium]
MAVTAPASRMKYVVAGTVVAVAGAFAVLMAVRPARAEQFATLGVLNGSVSVSANGAPLAAARDGMSLSAGDVVQTGDPGRAVIRYFDGSQTRLDSNTRFEITELSALKNVSQGKVIRGKQSSGATFNRIVKLTDSRSRMEIEAPTSTASVRGTSYSGTRNPDGTFTWRVFEGRVRITDEQGRSVVLEAGEGVVVTEDGELGEPYELSEEELEAEWVTYNNCELDGIDCPEEPQVLGERREGGPGEQPGGEQGANNQSEGSQDVENPGNAGAAGNGPTGNGPPGNGGADNGDAGGGGGGSGGGGNGGGDNGGGGNGGEPDPEPAPEPARLRSIVVSGSPQSPRAGAPATFRAEGFDQNGNSLGDVTGGTTFTISPNGTCAANVCTATVAGAHQVVGTNGSASDAVSFTVTPADPATIELSPASATITSGAGQAYTVEAFDAFGNTIGDVTASTTLSISPNGSCAGATCSAVATGQHIVTGGTTFTISPNGTC